MLTNTARKEEQAGHDYTSARLVSKGKGDFLYGRVEVRAKLPSGRGTWPAIWMLPTDWAYGGWPHSGEIDIMEQVGFDPDVIHFSAHTGAYYHLIGTQKTATKRIADATSAFHRYRVDWTPDMIRGYIDDVPMFAFANEHNGPEVWPFDKRFHLILNVAVGGFWGGQKGIDDAIFPASMQVDYVRVYRMADPNVAHQAELLASPASTAFPSRHAHAFLPEPPPCCRSSGVSADAQPRRTARREDADALYRDARLRVD